MVKKYVETKDKYYSIVNLNMVIMILAIILKIRILISIHLNDLLLVETKENIFNNYLFNLTSIIIFINFFIGIVAILLLENNSVKDNLSKIIKKHKKNNSNNCKFITGDVNCVETDSNKMTLVLPFDNTKKQININNINLENYKKLKITYSCNKVKSWKIFLKRNIIGECYLFGNDEIEEDNTGKITEIIDIPRNILYNTVSINACGLKSEEGSFNIYEIMLLA